MTYVGIFWFVPSNIALTSTIVEDMTPVAEASSVGNTLVHARSHEEYWGQLAELGERKLRRRGMPRIIARTRYDDYPRGHVEYDRTSGRFEIHTDNVLSGDIFMNLVRALFGITDRAATIRLGQYHARCGPVPLPNEVL